MTMLSKLFKLQANYIFDLAHHFDGGILSDEAIAGEKEVG